MGKVIIKQVKSGIDRDKNQKLTLKALGLRKVYHSVEKENTDSINLTSFYVALSIVIILIVFFAGSGVLI